MRIRFSVGNNAGWRHFEREVPAEILAEAEWRKDLISFFRVRLADPRIDGAALIWEPVE